MPSCLMPELSSSRTSAKDPVGLIRIGRPDLRPVDDEIDPLRAPPSSEARRGPTPRRARSSPGTSGSPHDTIRREMLLSSALHCRSAASVGPIIVSPKPTSAWGRSQSRASPAARTLASASLRPPPPYSVRPGRCGPPLRAHDARAIHCSSGSLGKTHFWPPQTPVDARSSGSGRAVTLGRVGLEPSARFLAKRLEVRHVDMPPANKLGRAPSVTVRLRIFPVPHSENASIRAPCGSFSPALADFVPASTGRSTSSSSPSPSGDRPVFVTPRNRPQSARRRRSCASQGGDLHRGTRGRARGGRPDLLGARRFPGDPGQRAETEASSRRSTRPARSSRRCTTKCAAWSAEKASRS